MQPLVLGEARPATSLESVASLTHCALCQPMVAPAGLCPPSLALPHLLVEMNGWVIPTQEKHGLQLIPNLDPESRKI